jgi:hypothetical protein
MEWGLARKVAVLLLLPIAGCGGAGDGGSTASTVPATQGSTSAERAAEDPSDDSAEGSAETLLIKAGDLPGGEAKANSIPEPCSPIPLLEEQGAAVAGTPLLNLQGRSVAEVAGIFQSTAEARQALAELQEQERMACIQSTIESFRPAGHSVRIGKPEPVAAGDEGSTVRLVEMDPASNPVNFITIVSVRSGRCVATMLFLTKADGDAGFIDGASNRAYERLEDASSVCR